jgi:hypothetical protein
VVKEGAVIQRGTTGTDGKIRIRIQGGVSTLQLLDGSPVAEYEVSIRDDAIEAATTPEGLQRRLRMLGYQIGHDGPEGNGVDGTVAPGVAMDRAILEFQVDQSARNLVIDSIVGNNTRNALIAEAGA